MCLSAGGGEALFQEASLSDQSRSYGGRVYARHEVKVFGGIAVIVDDFYLLFVQEVLYLLYLLESKLRIAAVRSSQKIREELEFRRSYCPAVNAAGLIALAPALGCRYLLEYNCVLTVIPLSRRVSFNR